MKKTIFVYVNKGIIALIALMSLFTLFFPLLAFYAPGYVPVSENGFDLMAMESAFITSSYKTGAIALGICSILELILATVALVLGGLNFIKGEHKAMNISVLVLAFSNALLYLIEGIAFYNIFVATSGISSSNLAFLSTGCFVPFILQSLLLPGFIVFSILIAKAGNNELVRRVVVAPATKVSDQAQAEMTEVAQIKKYKELLDAGLITQEEFDAKRRKIMGI